MPSAVDNVVARRLLAVREVISGMAPKGARIAECQHRNCCGPFFGSWPYLVDVPAGQGLPSKHGMRDPATSAYRTCNNGFHLMSSEAAAGYLISPEFDYLPTACDLAQIKATKEAAKKSRNYAKKKK